MPTLSQFLAYVRSLVGVWTDQDGAFGAQCVDLILHVYVKFWNTFAWGNAVDFQHNNLPAGFQRGTPEAMGVQPGDILVWHFGPNDQYGHVGICVEVNPDGTVTSVEQNIDGTPEIGGVGRLKTRNLGYCVAVIRPAFAQETVQAPTQPQNQIETGENNMSFTFRIQGDKQWDANTIYFYNGNTNEIRGLAHPDELAIVKQVHKDCNGKDMPHYDWQAAAPWYARLFRALNPNGTNDLIKEAIKASKDLAKTFEKSLKK